mgnify:FL=1
MSHHDYRRETRHQALELLIRWEGGCNATTLGELFSLDRTNAGRDFRDYRARFGGIEYDASRRQYRANCSFRCHFSDGSLDEYVALCARHKRHEGIFDFATASPIPVREPVIQNVVAAVLNRVPIDITSRSWNHPAGIERRIHPHAIAFSGLRWHARAFDKRTHSYRDFNLNRIIALDTVRGVTYVSGDKDLYWNTRAAIKLIANPKLSTEERMMVEAEYGMTNGTLLIRPRQAMCHYVLQSLNAEIVDNQAACSGRARPIVVANPEDIRPFLFGNS